jgi:hypothetical protein
MLFNIIAFVLCRWGGLIFCLAIFCKTSFANSSFNGLPSANALLFRNKEVQAIFSICL